MLAGALITRFAFAANAQHLAVAQAQHTVKEMAEILESKGVEVKVLIWGSIAAVVVRAIASIFVVWLLKIPGFLLAGGAVLLYIAYKLVKPQDQGHDEIAVTADATLRQAVTTIVVADMAMGIENVLAVGGAAHGNVMLVIIGLLISVPIIMFGSQLVLKMVDRFPHIITLGGAILAWTAVKMMLGEPALDHWFEIQDWMEVPLYVAAVGGVLYVGFRGRKLQAKLDVSSCN